uniref:C2H2-type domain-containing protein n=1 Tax=Dendroctonus ponderosae TaxID=77166 RepID=A0AAR5PV31_DENPD
MIKFVAKLEAKRIADLQPKDHGVYCNVCGKSFGTDNAYENHINSKKHKEKAAHFTGAEQSTRARSPVPVEPTEISIDPGENEDDWDDVDNPIDNNDSIFCLKHSKSFMDNLDHMTIVHSFFIPDIEYCSDVQGLLSYLGSKISAGFMCLCRVAVPELDGSDYKLVLPSGVTIGHRSLMRFYKQSFYKPNRDMDLVLKKDKHLHKVLASYRALGWSQTDQRLAAKTARDVHFLKRMQSKYMMKLGVKSNKLQTHFRQQINY